MTFSRLWHGEVSGLLQVRKWSWNNKILEGQGKNSLFLFWVEKNWHFEKKSVKIEIITRSFNIIDGWKKHFKSMWSPQCFFFWKWRIEAATISDNLYYLVRNFFFISKKSVNFDNWFCGNHACFWCVFHLLLALLWFVGGILGFYYFHANLVYFSKCRV